MKRCKKPPGACIRKRFSVTHNVTTRAIGALYMSTIKKCFIKWLIIKRIEEYGPRSVYECFHNFYVFLFQIECVVEARQLHDKNRRKKNYKYAIGEPLVTDHKITEGWYSLDQYRLMGGAEMGNLTGGSCGTRYQIVMKGKHTFLPASH